MSGINNQLPQTQISQQQLTSAEAIQLLVRGNDRFVQRNPLVRNTLLHLDASAKGQYPFAAILSCIDSRVPTEIVFDQGIGDLFNAKVAGNFVNDDILGSLEYACKVAGSKVIVVLGHTSCGAVKSTCDHVELGNITQLLAKIAPALDEVKTPEGSDRTSKNMDFVNTVAEKNVELTIANIKSGSSILSDQYQKGEIDIVGAMYDVASGKVHFL